MNTNLGVAAGKTKQTRKTVEGFRHRKSVKNPLFTTEFKEAVNNAWRRSFLNRGTTLPHVPNTYVIPYNGDMDDLSGLSPL